MKRTAFATVAAIALMGISPASAGISSGDDENDYEGGIENVKGYYFGFDLNGAKTKVKGITARVGYECDNDDLVVTLVEADGSLRLNDAGRFSGRVNHTESPDSKVQYEVHGKLKKQGNSEGTLRGTYTDPFYETPCKTGEVDWRAKRGAEVEVR